MGVEQAETFYVGSKLAVINVLAGLIEKPDLFLDNNYHFSVKDFPERFHQIVFGAVEYLALKGLGKIQFIDIDEFLKQYPEQYQVYIKNDGNSYIQKAVAMYDSSNFEYYYRTLKKYSLLNQLSLRGIDTKDIYDPDIIDPIKSAQMSAKFDALDINDILNAEEIKFLELKQEYGTNIDLVENRIGDDIEDLVEQYKKSPMIGLPLMSPKLTTIYRGMRKGCVYMTSSGSGFGKALPNSTIIPMADGSWKQVGDVKPGDQLIDRTGKPTTVLSIHPQGLKDVYKVTFKDGRTALCNDEHLWTIHYMDRSDDSLCTKTLREIIDEADIKGFRKSDKKAYRYGIPVNQPVQYQKQELKLDPWVLGCLLGNGSFRESSNNRNLSFSDGEGIIVNRIASIMGWTAKRNSLKNYSYYFKNKDGKNIHVTEFCNEFDLLELYNCLTEDKTIPERYLKGNIDQRLQLLNGLLDTDGSCGEKGRVTFSSINRKLVDQISELCRSLGLIPTIHTDNRPYKYSTGECYTLIIMGSRELKKNLFTLERKHNKLIDWYTKSEDCKNKISYKYLQIANIEKLDYQEEMTCFYVDNDEHLFLMNDYIVTHNTRLMVADAVHLGVGHFFDNDKKKWVHTGYSEKVLLIETELELEEIQTMVLACVSGVPESNILDGRYFGDQEERVKQAAKYVKEASNNFYMAAITNYNTADLINIIKKYNRLYQVEYVFYDYLSENLKIIAEGSSKAKVSGLRTDQILLSMITALKDCAKQYQLFIATSTQLSGDFINSKSLDASFLRAAKSLGDKVDVGAILMPVREMDQDVINTFTAKGFTEVPNFVISVYKIRRGSYQNIKVYIKFDRGTCRVYDAFVTNNNGELLEIENTNIEILLDQTRTTSIENAVLSTAELNAIDDDDDFEF